MMDVNRIAVVEGGDGTAILVKHLHFCHAGSRDGDLAGGGVGVEGDVAKFVDGTDADFSDSQLQHYDAVAACLGLAFEDVLSTLGVGVALPLVAASG